MKVTVVGYGIVGRLVALKLQDAGHEVTVLTRENPGEASATAWVAGGMIAPFCERESSDAPIFKVGVESRSLWAKLLEKLQSPDLLSNSGTLVLCQKSETAAFQDYAEKICQRATTTGVVRLAADQVTEYAPGLSIAPGEGLWIPSEALLDPWTILPKLQQAFEEAGGRLIHGAEVSIEGDTVQSLGETWESDRVIDCRGIGANNDHATLRGVRGEALLVHAPDVELKHGVRLIDPHLGITVLPRSQNRYYVGATCIEDEATHPITVRSTVNMLSAAYQLHHGFGEACIEKTFVGIRPAYDHNNPEIRHRGNLLSINGLYRHGFLLGPHCADAALHWLEGGELQTITPFVEG